MKKIIALTTLAGILFLSGCTDATELGNRAIIQAAAIDYDGKYHVTAMLFSSSGSGGDTIDASQENVIRVAGKGETLAAAIDDISLIDGKRIYMSETKLLILGSGFERTDALDALKTLYFDMRCSLNMPVCCVKSKENASDILNIKFTEGMTAADKPLSLIENAFEMGVSPKTTLLDLLADSAGRRTSLLPLLSITENGSGMTTDDNGTTAVLSGSRYFTNGVLCGEFDAEKTSALMILSERSHCITLNYLYNDEERTCEAYNITVSDDPEHGDSVKRITAKFRTRNGGSLSSEERKAALSALTSAIEKAM